MRTLRWSKLYMALMKGSFVSYQIRRWKFLITEQCEVCVNERWEQGDCARAESLGFHHHHILSWYRFIHVMFVSRFTASNLIQSSCFPSRRLIFFCMGNKTGLKMQADTAPIPTETPSQRRRCAERGAHKVGSKAGLSCPPKTEVIRTGLRAATTRCLHSDQVPDLFHCPWLWGTTRPVGPDWCQLLSDPTVMWTEKGARLCWSSKP